ncbi:class I SAM-dependent methyltransferase [Oleiagrimonas sp. C23AA]|uniref:class I SAM-dependent methyltransferase n=1 Tax=Oleiagrimonas sp. C23AA TaxID=2719047 RepID=UPI0014228B01|nr:class I SAM-dependent methyltransferase [Oleiagrimonas sp. C23AA]NII11158.1 class I SAM-dependent methyltransferase [Oleiagrimonas sp. C23AA]
MLKAKTFFDMPPMRLTPRMEEDFFTSLMMRNGTYKTTFHDRFAEVNPYLVRYLREHASASPQVLDIGVSSGISTLELHENLRAGGLNVQMLGTDVLIDAFLVTVFPGCHALVDPSGFPLRFDVPGGSMKPWVTRRDYYSGVFIARKLINKLFTYRARRMLEQSDAAIVRAVKLVTPRALVGAEITFCCDDVSQYNPAYAARFDFVRAANVLNRGYFNAAVLSSMVRNIGRYLRPTHGSLFVTRTHDDRTNHGTLFRMAANQYFEVVHRFGSGSEVEDVVTQTRITP